MGWSSRVITRVAAASSRTSCDCRTIRPPAVIIVVSLSIMARIRIMTKIRMVNGRIAVCGTLTCKPVWCCYCCSRWLIVR